jgi:hypothetical protein
LEPEAEADICGSAELTGIQLAALAWFNISLADINESEFFSASLTHKSQVRSPAKRDAEKAENINNSAGNNFFAIRFPSLKSIILNIMNN